MKVYDYCSQKSLAIGSAQELYPQFSAESRDCVKNGSHVMLGKCLTYKHKVSTLLKYLI